ncbi:MAG: DUF1232 domain-containing protein [Deltaproteobacteria bacterium]|nr:DUF1232 domain-containing protein [Deltaproteobacteria bacterium]
MATRICPACGKAEGSNARCRPCRDAAARELADHARDVTVESLGDRAAQGERFAERPPWYVRFAPLQLVLQVRLLAAALRDWRSGAYREIPWSAVAILAAALAYVVSPVDLIPDFLVPVGWTDDLVVLAVAWRTVKQQLRAYCAWKGLTAGRYGL